MTKPMSLGTDNQIVIAVIVAVIVVLLTLIYSYLRLRKSSRRGILITGICDSGKTLLFARLAFNKYVDTHTSAKENLAHYPPGKTEFQLIDVPGHERMRNKYLEEYKTTSRALIYVIDSNTFQKEIRDVAEYLFNLLTDKVIINNCKKILILCNKQDAPMAKDSKVIKGLLEKELNTLRDTKGSELSSTDESGRDSRVHLGNQDQDFTFSQISVQVDFAESCAVASEDSGPDLEELTNWIKIATL